MQFKSGSITRTGGSRTTDQLSIVATGPRTAGINIPKPRSLMTVPSKRFRAPGPRRKRYIDNIIFSLSLSLFPSCLKKAGSDDLFTLDPKFLAVRYPTYQTAGRTPNQPLTARGSNATQQLTTQYNAIQHTAVDARSQLYHSAMVPQIYADRYCQAHLNSTVLVVVVHCCIDSTADTTPLLIQQAKCDDRRS